MYSIYSIYSIYISIQFIYPYTRIDAINRLYSIFCIVNIYIDNTKNKRNITMSDI